MANRFPKQRKVWRVRASVFGFLSDFGFRASDLPAAERWKDAGTGLTRGVTTLRILDKKPDR